MKKGVTVILSATKWNDIFDFYCQLMTAYCQLLFMAENRPYPNSLL
jgi:hypothetical protein